MPVVDSLPPRYELRKTLDTFDDPGIIFPDRVTMIVSTRDFPRGMYLPIVFYSEWFEGFFIRWLMEPFEGPPVGYKLIVGNWNPSRNPLKVWSEVYLWDTPNPINLIPWRQDWSFQLQSALVPGWRCDYDVFAHSVCWDPF